MSSYVVTGSARGIGFEFVNQLSASSPTNTVFALVRNIRTAQELIALKRENVHILEADITNVDALKAAAVEVSKITGGRLDYLINNAAFVDDEYPHLTLDAFPDPATLERLLVDSYKINVVSVINTINIFLPLLKAPNTAKKVIVISSGVADSQVVLDSGNALIGPYAISKAAVNLAVAKFAAQYKKDGFVFLALSPGWVDTSVGPPTPESLAVFHALLALFQKSNPALERQLTTQESVLAQLEVIHKWQVEDTGAFVSHRGDKNWLSM